MNLAEAPVTNTVLATRTKRRAELAAEAHATDAAGRGSGRHQGGSQRAGAGTACPSREVGSVGARG
jgi:hypothetical protein